MNPSNTPLTDLPKYWQEQVRKLRDESSKLRRERNEARQSVAGDQVIAAISAAVWEMRAVADRFYPNDKVEERKSQAHKDQPDTRYICGFQGNICRECSALGRYGCYKKLGPI
jgi:hypothetical protein